MSRIFAVFLLLVVLAVGGSAIAATAYQAGLTTAVAQVPADGATTVVTPVVVHGYGWGFPGFGIFGFFATLFFIFLVFGLLRAIFWGGRGHRNGWGGPGWGPGGPGGPGRGWDQDGSPWRDRAHGTFETWHREAHASGEGHGAPGGPDAGSGAATTGTTGTTGTFGGPAAPSATPA